MHTDDSISNACRYYGKYASIPVCQISYADNIKSFYEHCSLSKTYMYSDDEVVKRDIEEFLAQGMLCQLSDFSAFQSHQLKSKGEIVYNDLMNLS